MNYFAIGLSRINSSFSLIAAKTLYFKHIVIMLKKGTDGQFVNL